MAALVSTLVLLSAACATLAQPVRQGYVVRDGQKGTMTWLEEGSSGSTGPPKGALVYGEFADSVSEVGTGKLALRTIATAPDDSHLFEALGYAEGLLTSYRILQHMHNMLTNPISKEVSDFTVEHTKYIKQSADFYGGSDPYWGVVRVLVARNDGLREGLKHALRSNLSEHLLLGQRDIVQPEVLVAALQARVTFFTTQPDDVIDAELMRLNLVMDIDEVARAVKFQSAAEASKELDEHVQKAHARMTGGHGHCSVLIKKVGSRLIFGHNTWKSYAEMLRIWKDISITHVKNPAIINRRLSYPSYPGYFASTDDWYSIPDSQLVVFETTDDAHDTARLAKYVRPSTINTPLRSVIASLMAGSAREWYEIFSRENSGTQNNQWMILDLGAWQRSQSQKDPAPKDIFWVLEQQPGLIIGKDMTKHLLEHGYWSSYNVPHFEETMRVSQTAEYESTTCVCEGQRGALLKEGQARVHSVHDMQKLLTSNPWKSTPSAWSCPKCAIASRFDLEGTNTTMGMGMQKPGPIGCGVGGVFGAIDAKVADDLMGAQGETLFVSGPARDGVPAFSWATAQAAMPPGQPLPDHVGHPNEAWTFPWLRLGLAPAEVGQSEAPDSLLLYA